MTDTVKPTQADLIERLECFDWGCPNAEKIAKEAANTIATQAAEIARMRSALEKIIKHGRNLAIRKIAQTALQEPSP